MKIPKFFCNAKTSKKTFAMHDFNRLKKNKKLIFSVEIAQNPTKFEIESLPNMMSSRPRDQVT